MTLSGNCHADEPIPESCLFCAIAQILTTTPHPGRCALHFNPRIISPRDNSAAPGIRPSDLHINPALEEGSTLAFATVLGRYEGRPLHFSFEEPAESEEIQP